MSICQLHLKPGNFTVCNCESYKKTSPIPEPNTLSSYHTDCCWYHVMANSFSDRSLTDSQTYTQIRHFDDSPRLNWGQLVLWNLIAGYRINRAAVIDTGTSHFAPSYCIAPIKQRASIEQRSKRQKGIAFCEMKSRNRKLELA